MRLHRPARSTARAAAPSPRSRRNAVLLVRRGDHQDLADARQHERRQRVVDHRLVVDRQQLLAHRERERMQPRAGAAGQDDPLHDERVLVSTLRAARELAPPASAAARWKTASSIGRVSRPVNVFCWLGWYEQRSTSPDGSRCSAAVREARPRARHGAPARAPRRRGTPSCAIAPRATTTRTRVSSASSPSSQRRQVAISVAGRACSRAARSGRRRSRTRRAARGRRRGRTDVGWFAKPARCSAA